MSTSQWSTRGSEWHRWDPHLHGPGTALNDQFKGDWEAYLLQIENSTPQVEALGVTDYFSIDVYREVRKRKAKGRLSNVGLVFPNVEVRLDIQTDKKRPVNLHLLFCPDDPKHESEIERILSFLTFPFQGKTYQCTARDLLELGRAFNPKQTDDLGALREGARQFKTTFADLVQVYQQDEWFRKHALIAVSGSSTDGTAGLQDDDTYAATRRAIESFAHIIFASTPSQRDFWLGKKTAIDAITIEKTYGALKPCLHGSDAHKPETTVAPDGDRYCWLKGDIDFETLRQVVLEPDERVWIGKTAPDPHISTDRIKRIVASGTPWLATNAIDLNAGMVAVIGARGSGKTALVDIIASGSGAVDADLKGASFLERAQKHLSNADVNIFRWDDSSVHAPLLPAPISDPFEQRPNGVCYLSQHFVERLCSSAGLATELRAEIERVVFDRTDPTERLEANTFEELIGLLLAPIRRRRHELIANITSATNAITEEDVLIESTPKLKKDRDAIQAQLGKDQAELGKLIPKGKEARAKRLNELEQACGKVETQIEALRRRRRQLDDLSEEVEQIRNHGEPVRLAQMRQRFTAIGLSEAEWSPFAMTFSGDVDEILKKAKTTADQAITVASEGNADVVIVKDKTPLDDWPLKLLKEERDKIKKEVGIDVDKQRKYEQLRQAISQREVAKRRLEAEIKRADGAEVRRRAHIQTRRSTYTAVFGTLVKEQQVLEDLYAPLKKELQTAEGALAKLQFVVSREIDLNSWVKKGEELLDLRKASAFQGRGTLKAKSEEHLLGAWRSGTAEQVAAAMETFRSDFHTQFKLGMPSSTSEEGRAYREWVQSIASWLYDLSHIQVRYGIEYDGVAIEQLSPGTRGIVLLLLYLALDKQDRRPLVVDQPEESLDPKSVNDELVPHFRAARKRRQVIIVTHNANLVVNADVDQVIVAKSVQLADGGLPTISYDAGSLENPNIRRSVCEILEGGERAFLSRAQRYRLYWK